MMQARRPLATIVAAMLLLAQWSIVQHLLSHLDGSDSAPAVHHTALCAECAGALPLLAFESAAAPALELDPTVEATPASIGSALVRSEHASHYESRAPPT